MKVIYTCYFWECSRTPVGKDTTETCPVLRKHFERRCCIEILFFSIPLLNLFLTISGKFSVNMYRVF